MQPPPENSFQIVVATDGTQSYAIILFSEVNFVWAATTRIIDGSTTHWTAPYNDDITQAPIMMQYSYTPGVYVLNLIDFSSPLLTTVKIILSQLLAMH